MRKLSNKMLFFISVCVAFTSFSLIQFVNISHLLVGEANELDMRKTEEALVNQKPNTPTIREKLITLNLTEGGQ